MPYELQGKYSFHTTEDFITWAGLEDRWLEVEAYIKSITPGPFLDALVVLSLGGELDGETPPYSSDDSYAIKVIKIRTIGLTHDVCASAWGAHSVDLRSTYEDTRSIAEAVAKVSVMEWIHELRWS